MFPTKTELIVQSDHPSPDTLSISTSSRPARTLLQSWLKTCLVQHSCCAKLSIGGWTPTRVLDLGSTSSTWKLCIPAVDGVPVPRYTTMSYRWGNSHFLKLTSDSLEIFRSGLPISDLPQAFQDAISITKDLGIRFIWIDALCILQDVRDDFAQECASMSSIYANSSCNIVATFGKNPHTSIFRTRNHQSFQIGKFINPWKIHDSRRDVWLENDSIVKGDHLSKEMLSCEISSRGWILQELLLAPRALYFGMSQVHWVCQVLEACEIWPKGLPNVQTLINPHSYLFRSSNHHQKYDDMNQWNYIVERYSTLTLSHTEDKLVALSGLAKFFQHRTQDEYFWGHWKSALPQSLNWFKPSGFRHPNSWKAKTGSAAESCGRRSSVYRAPSWSWASIDGLVGFPKFGYDNEIVICNVLEVHANKTGPNPSNRAVEGLLTVRAPWKTVEVFGNKLSMSGSSSKAPIYPKWDGDFIPDGTEVDLVVTFITCNDFTRHTSEEPFDHSGRMLCINTLILLPLKANPGFHMRVGTVSIDSDFQEDLIPRTELEAFGLNVMDEDFRNISVAEESSFRTFKLI